MQFCDKIYRSLNATHLLKTWTDRFAHINGKQPVKNRCSIYTPVGISTISWKMDSAQRFLPFSLPIVRQVPQAHKWELLWCNKYYKDYLYKDCFPFSGFEGTLIGSYGMPSYGMPSVLDNTSLILKLIVLLLGKKKVQKYHVGVFCSSKLNLFQAHSYCDWCVILVVLRGHHGWFFVGDLERK